MASQHLSVDDFFAKLVELFEARHRADHGSIFLTQKRLTYNSPELASQSTAQPPTADPAATNFSDLQPVQPLPVLMRATDGKRKPHRAERIKLSTVVQPEGLGTFYARYAEVCKAGMQGLKKRDRSGRKKARAKKKKDAT